MVSSVMVLEIQSNKAHRLRTTDNELRTTKYIHDKSNTPHFFSKVVKMKIENVLYFALTLQTWYRYKFNLKNWFIK
jgi:hypothetical protein